MLSLRTFFFDFIALAMPFADHSSLIESTWNHKPHLHRNSLTIIKLQNKSISSLHQLCAQASLADLYLISSRLWEISRQVSYLSFLSILLFPIFMTFPRLPVLDASSGEKHDLAFSYLTSTRKKTAYWAVNLSHFFLKRSLFIKDKISSSSGFSSQFPWIYLTLK